MGSNTFLPLTFICKKHTVVSQSSTEAEIVALDTVLRSEGLPLLSWWETLKPIFASPASFPGGVPHSFGNPGTFAGTIRRDPDRDVGDHVRALSANTVSMDAGDRVKKAP